MTDRRLYRPSNPFRSSRFPLRRSRVPDPSPYASQDEVISSNMPNTDSSRIIQSTHTSERSVQNSVIDDALTVRSSSGTFGRQFPSASLLSMFQLSYPTIMSEQMKMIRNELNARSAQNRSINGPVGSMGYFQPNHLDPYSTYGSDDVTSHRDQQTSHYQNNVGQSMPMTLVETISFSTSDFTDNFLTCPTCLSNFDEYTRLPRLLPCSHTICRECLERIVANDNAVDLSTASLSAETIRCPVCREAILMPRGGLDQLPPSYLVNRLMDLVPTSPILLSTKKTRDYIPKCTIHSAESLLFCETCDCVFCPMCEESHQAASSALANGQLGGHSLDAGKSYLSTTADSSVVSSAHEHIVVPYSIAIKRVSEIVSYKCGQCTHLLDNAVMAIRQEMERLDFSVQLASNALDKSFSEICEQVERRKVDLKESLNNLKDQKMQSLTEQLEIVQAERTCLELQNMKLLRRPDIRKLTDQIQSLNSQVDSGQLLAEPRENSFIKFESHHNESGQGELARAIEQFGRIKVSNTYPPLCTAKVDGCVANVRCSVSVTAMDYNGNVQNVGGDPLTVSVSDPQSDSIDYRMEDTLAGSYNISFLPRNPGRYKIDVKIFNRHIRGSPMSVNISEHNNPIWVTDPVQSISNPIDIAFMNTGHILALDCGSNQINVLDGDTGACKYTLCSKPHVTSATVCFCKIATGLFCVVDWRQRKLQLMRFSALDINQTGDYIAPKVSIRELDHDCKDLSEPVHICFSDKTFDNGKHLGCLIIMDSGLEQLVFIDLFKKSNKQRILIAMSK